MRNILILGAAGQIARQAIHLFLEEIGVKLTLVLRNAKRYSFFANNPRIKLVEADVRDIGVLQQLMHNQEVVYANLSGDMAGHAHNVVAAMQANELRRLIFITSMGVYDEVPGDPLGSILQPYREATQIIEASALDYTILRPAWLNDRDDINYGITQKGETFIHPEATVSRRSVADLVVKAALNHSHIGASLGVHRR
ncbi:NAD(P)H-binding protein [Shewanella sp. A3A]|uniref:NAD(P)H-binding protein n=1 Tax=Shewanella electrica TaxID=515560 RepID=A0ABT2FQC3_9GAMM|nr:NAD(P)H-binding protein [Shewanella electrica]MCH1919867.1 NAD(P)H-binding protein [Shewanella ferrihydritica]MCH1925989.1 NAD(P)H-binding protein [Shewanella electrica]MCS4557404.1 NAD(P)H-binding protein [Shewanella electrica]